MKPLALRLPRVRKSVGNGWLSIMVKPASSPAPITQVPQRLSKWMQR
ncbi:hypothetical protein QE440_004365 [Pseudomonas psychrotolerans]|uniref:Uncharacterized protein n=1 Tax=Pseudomonas oryzihabitans TaxID=47885 RepID=A0AAJ2EYM6_9PSED|nr:hypothetical protein [Pseudomonas psychrotolerans]